MQLKNKILFLILASFLTELIFISNIYFSSSFAREDTPSVWLGVEITKEPNLGVGGIVNRVIENSPASKMGIQEGDTITSISCGLKVKYIISPQDLVSFIQGLKPGDKITLWIIRNHVPFSVSGVLEEKINKAERESEEIKQEKSAQQELALIEYIRIGNTLHEYYDNVRRYIGVKAGGLYDFLLSEFLSDKNAAARFAAKLAAHDIGLRSKYWRELEDRLEAKYYRATKGRYSYIDARKKIDNVIEYIGIDEYETDEKKMRKILDFVNVNDFVHYEEDFNQVVNFPLETLTLKSGDCDDFSILVAALFKRVGINSAIAFFKSRTGREGHAMVLFQSKESLPFYSYNDLAQFDLEWGKWYLIEPQKRFDGQNDPSLVNKWIIESAASVSQVSQK